MRNWRFSRWAILVAGLFLSGQAIYFRDAVPALLGLFLLYRALTGRGCLVQGFCFGNMDTEDIRNKNDRNRKDIEYTIIEEN